MSKMIKLIPFFGLFFIISCSDNNQESNSTVTTLKKEPPKRVEINTTKEDESLLNKMGIEFENKKIIIDLNKSENFLSEIKNKVETKAKELKKEIEKSDIISDINSTFN